ncbi:MAG: cupin domain-containing protein [Acetobacteraceae bacterium]|nr:cupin domain-containing protein [Acetobacteraceae bacterium]
MLLPPGTALHNPYNSETFLFDDAQERADLAGFRVRLGAGGSGAGNALLHVHPGADEHFRVIRGRLRVRMGDRDHPLAAGETLTVPRGTPHCFFNGHDDETEMAVSFTPGQRHLRFFIDVAYAAAHHPGWWKPDGGARLLPMALLLDAYPQELRLAGPPAWVQRALFAALAPVARARGYALPLPPDAASLRHA